MVLPLKKFSNDNYTITELFLLLLLLIVHLREKFLVIRVEYVCSRFKKMKINAEITI